MKQMHAFEANDHKNQINITSKMKIETISNVYNSIKAISIFLNYQLIFFIFLEIHFFVLLLFLFLTFFIYYNEMRRFLNILLSFLLIAITSQQLNQDISQRNTTRIGNQDNNQTNKQLPQAQVKCIAKCRNNRICYQNCLNGSVTPIIIVIFASVLSCLTVTICCSICYKMNLFTNLPCHHFAQLKKKYNIVDPGDMTNKKFEQIVDKIVENINHSKNGNYTHEHSKSFNIKAEATIEKRSRFLIQLKVAGKDYNGKWKGVAFIVCRNKGQVFFWMYKMYESKFMNKACLVLQFSTKVEQDGKIEGVWNYMNDQNQKGQWKLENKQGNISSGCSLIVKQSNLKPIIQQQQKANFISSSSLIKAQLIN